uniref:Glycosyl transferase n=1 Tax=Thermosporothrix sp. COM3 TaxID=2490863 RepID=A0A455SKK8_9CHLR|nr:glycosyl transferase [Thermosporothrix sp. COM3]
MKHMLRIALLEAVRVAGLPGAIAARAKAQQPLPERPRILLIRPDHLGDMVMTTPVLDALRAYVPTAQITMMVGPWAADVVARHPAIDHLRTCAFPGFRRTAQSALEPYTLLRQIAHELREEHYDLAINLRNDFWWGAALMYLAGIPRRVGYALAPAEPFLTHALPFRPHQHSTFYNLELTSAGLEALGLPALEQPFAPERYPLVFTPTTDEQRWLQTQLEQAGIDEKTEVLVIHPGTGGAVKLWRNAAWTRSANALLNRYPTARLVLTGSPAEHEMLEAIAQGIEPRPLLLSQMTTGQLAALLKRASLVLGVDNGPLHLAVAQGTPTVRLFGPTDPAIFGPWGPANRHIVITSQEKCPSCPCIPCGRLDFRPDELDEHPCVKRIPEQAVEEAACTLLNTFCRQ